MPTRHQITFHNQSQTSGAVVLFQYAPDALPSNAYPLAWMVEQSTPHQQNPFVWEDDYNFYWGQSGHLQPGGAVFAGGRKGTELDKGNQITYAHSYDLEDQTDTTPGVLRINVAEDTPQDMFAVGIGMNLSCLYAVQAVPGQAVNFQPRPTYWMAIGNFRPGEVLDFNAIPNKCQIQFPAGIHNLTVVLNADLTWEVRS